MVSGGTVLQLQTNSAKEIKDKVSRKLIIHALPTLPCFVLPLNIVSYWCVKMVASHNLYNNSIGWKLYSVLL